jgi:hypothetical protein
MTKYEKDGFYETYVKLWYKHDDSEYKKHRDYYDSYAPYCRKHDLIPITRDYFLEDLKKRINTEDAQGYINMLHEGKTIGECNAKYGFTFDESGLIIKSATVTNSFLGKEARL